VSPVTEPIVGPDASTFDAAAATTGATVLRGSAWNVLRMTLPQINVLALSITAARFLGPDGMGRQSFIAFVELTVIMFCTSGLPVAVMRYASAAAGAGRHGTVRSLIGWAWRLEGTAAVFGGLCLVVVALTRQTLQSAWLLAALAAAIGIIATVPSAAVIALQAWRATTLISIGIGVASTATSIVVLALDGGVVGMFAVEAAFAAVNLAAVTVIARRRLRALHAPPEPIDDMRDEVLRFAGWATVGAILTFVVWRRSEFLFLARYANPTEIAVYSVAFAVSTALVVLTDSVAGVLAPAMATLFGAGELERIRAAVSRSVRLLLLLALPMAAGAIAVGPLMLRVVYGAEYDRSGEVLAVLMIPFPLLMLRTVSVPAMTGLGRVKPMLVVGAFAAVANVSLDVALIPAHGAVGAAWANAGAQATYALLTFAVGIRYLGRPELDVAAIARAAVAAASCGVVAGVVAHAVDGAAGLVLGVTAGLAVYATLAVTLRIVPAGDAEWVGEAVGGRLGGLVSRVALRATAHPR
jgi:O-antigen/teichoic acid export membrane protein